MNLGGRRHRVASFFTLDRTQTRLRLNRIGLWRFNFWFVVAFRLGFRRLLGLSLRLLGFRGFIPSGDLIGDGLSLIGGFYRRFMNLGRGLQRLGRFFTLDRAQASRGHVFGVGFGFFVGPGGCSAATHRRPQSSALPPPLHEPRARPQALRAPPPSRP